MPNNNDATMPIRESKVSPPSVSISDVIEQYTAIGINSIIIEIIFRKSSLKACKRFLREAE